MKNQGAAQELAPQIFRSHGKLLLFGEHAAVYGHPALGMSLDNELTLKICRADTTAFPGLSRDEQNMARKLLARVRELRPDITFPPAEYSLYGDLPRSSGFGSSAAVCVCFARYIAELSAGTARVWQDANRLEELFHGKSSGIDTGLACRRGLYAFFFHDHPSQGKEKNLPEAVPLPYRGNTIYLIVGSVQRSGTSRKLITRILKNIHQPEIRRAIDRLGEYSRRSIDIFSALPPQPSALPPQPGTLPPQPGAILAELGGLICMARRELERLGLNHPDMDTILDEGIRLGALGGKLSGAGGGGAFYLLCRNEKSAQEIRERLSIYSAEHSLPLNTDLEITGIPRQQ